MSIHSKLIPPKRPRSYPGETIAVRTGCGTIFVTVTVDGDGCPAEVFATGKGGCLAASIGAIGRVTSVALRCGVDPQELANQLRVVSCISMVWDNGKKVTSCAAAMGIALQEMIDKYKTANKIVDAAPNIATVEPPVGEEAVEWENARIEIAELASERERQGL